VDTRDDSPQLDQIVKDTKSIKQSGSKKERLSTCGTISLEGKAKFPT
jgi:hypothetical protein